MVAASPAGVVAGPDAVFTTPADVAATVTPESSPGAVDKVLVFVEENHSFDQMKLIYKSGTGQNKSDIASFVRMSLKRVDDADIRAMRVKYSAVQTVLFCQSTPNTFHLFRPLRQAFALLEAVGIVSCFQDVTVMRHAIQ